MSSPIADLTYRNYDGPLAPPLYRWWAIAQMSMRMSMKKKGFWICMALVAIPYLFQMAAFYIMDTFGQNMATMGQKNPLLQNMVWKDRVLDGFSYGQLFYFIVALLIGAGTIANDNRANALLVYLSKPCSRLDYIVGKWLGMFLLFTGITILPAMLFYGYCFMGYRDYGFYTEDPMLIFKTLAMCLIPGAVHASLALGISSLFNQGRLAGAAYAGLYFIPLFITKAMQFIITGRGQEGAPSMVYRLFYCSVDGIQIGLAKLVLGTDGSSLFGARGGGRGGAAPMLPPPPPAPPALFITLMVAIPCVAALLIAWSRIKAVEVVG